MDVQNIETNSQQLDELVTALIGDKAVELDNYMTTVRACLLNTNQVSNEDLHLISLRLGVFMYALIDHVEKLNVRKGVSKEQAVYSENDALLKSTGTVQEKKAKAENLTVEDRLKHIAYSTATSILYKKIDGANTILSTIKNVLSSRKQEQVLTNIATSSVGGAF